jgi:short-subunit dehydrogenase
MRGCKRGISYHRALVTGATSGIGAAFARELPAAAALLLTGRNGERLAKMRAELERPDRKVDCVQADLARREDRDKLIALAEEFCIDLLINNAGLGPYGPVVENAADFERTAAEVNVVATADLTRRLLPGMISRARETGGARRPDQRLQHARLSTPAVSGHVCRQQDVYLDVYTGSDGGAPI